MIKYALGIGEEKAVQRWMAGWINSYMHTCQSEPRSFII